MKLCIHTSEGTPIERDVAAELEARVARRLSVISTRGDVKSAVRAAIEELQAEVRAETLTLGSAHR